jgi:hypothetical protein
MTTKGFDPNRTRVTDDTQAEWLRTIITGDLREVPGVGNTTIMKLAECSDNITTTYQLLGKFLLLKGQGIGTIEHADRFYYWLELIGTSAGHRSSVVRSVAEKLQLQFPDIYDEEIYSKDEEEEDATKKLNDAKTWGRKK